MPWVNIGNLTRLTYQNIRDFYTDMTIIYNAINSTGATYDPDYNPLTPGWETTGYGTYPTDILAKMQRTEANLDLIRNFADWVNPYYLYAMAWNNYTADKYERVKRWIDCINLDKMVIDGLIPKPEYLMGYTEDGASTEEIEDSDGNYIVCYGEEYFT